MATEIPFKADIDLGEGAKSLKSLKQEFKETQKELDGLTAGSEKYVQTLQKLGKIKDEIGDLNDEIKSFNPEGKVKALSNVIGGVASGFQAATGAAALFGNESEELQKTLLRVQAVMAFTEGIKGIVSLGDGFKVLGLQIKAAFASNPIGVILTAVTALASAFTAVYYSLDKTSESTRALNAELEVQKEVTTALARETERQIKLLTAQGKSELEILEAKKKLTQQELISLELSIKSHEAKVRDIKDNDSIWEATMRVASAIQAKLGNEQMAENFMKAIAINKAERAKEDLEAIKKEKEDLKDLRTTIEVLELEKTGVIKKESDTRVKEKKKAHQEIKRLEMDDSSPVVDNSTKDAEAEAETQRILKANKNRNELIRVQNEETYAGRQENLRIQRDADLLAAGEDAAAKFLIEQEYAEKTKELNAEVAKSGLDIAKSSTDSLMALSDLVFTIKFNNLQKGSKAELETAKKQFKINKALAITSAVISTIQGVVNALSAQSVIPEPFGTILKVATAVGVGIAGAANVAKIASTQFNAGGGSAPSISSAAPPSVSAPSINAPTNSSTLLNPDGSIQNNTPKNNPPVVKAIVVETDITSSQKRVNTIEEQATIK